jgi:hypothetical protein
MGEQVITPDMRAQLVHLRALNSPYLRQQPRDDSAAGKRDESAARRHDDTGEGDNDAGEGDNDAGERDNDAGKEEKTREGIDKEDEAGGE